MLNYDVLVCEIIANMVLPKWFNMYTYVIMNVFIFSVETMNQVMNVRAHVYKPLLNGDSITAQLIWQPLSQATSYDIIIFTADSSMDMNAVCVCVCIYMYV